jgi:ribonucleoside-diphosphate reductase alpha chain
MEASTVGKKKSRKVEDINLGARSRIQLDQDTAIADATQSIQIQRHFTFQDKDLFDTVTWSRRDARAGDFFQADVEAPDFWSDSAVGIVAKLYFATIDGVRESSVKTLITRVVNKITKEGLKFNYFNESGYSDKENAKIFEDELTYILLYQFAAFNSPVWFNLGVPGRKQTASACYLLNVEDQMFGEDSIDDWISNESRVFKSGAGAGVNLSKLRGSMEPLSTGGISSGPIAFMRVADANCAAIKAGNTRRGARLVCLDVDHPDILDFIDTKVREDKRMRALSEAGFNLDPSTEEGERNIAECTSFQNANISVRLSDKFMEAIENDGSWILTERTSGNIVGQTIPARELLEKIAEATWECADPGVIFDDTVNSWHTTPSLGRINTSNPCAETQLNDNSSCNLASLNLVKFLNDDNSFNCDDFYQVVDVMITAMDITCSFSEMPTKKIEENTRNLRQLGLGYSNLGAALMIQGISYDSDEARDWTASVTSLMTGRAYNRSAELASSLGPFLHYEDNKKSMRNILKKHYESFPVQYETSLWDEASYQWIEVDKAYMNDGYRNSQVTVIAPTGTSSFMMDCDTTGCEPAYSLVTYKKLASGGSMTLMNKSIKRALRTQGFLDSEIKKIEEDGLIHCIFSSPQFQTAAGDNPISPEGHLKMVAAIQPHISGSSSKTLNISESSTVEEIYNLYIGAWKSGVKCVAVYRDGSKSTQVLSAKQDTSLGDAPYDEVGKEFWQGGKLFQVQEDRSICERILTKKDLNSKIENSPTEQTPENVLHRAIEEAIKEGYRFKKLEKDIEYKKLSNLGGIPEIENSSIEKISKNVAQYNPEDVPDSSIQFTVNKAKYYAQISRKRMPVERKSITSKFTLGEHEGYITAGMYDDETLGEIFLSGIGKEGSTLNGLMDAWAISVSLGLQYGVPLQVLAEKFSHMDFEPKGLTNNPEIRVAKSMPDYIMRWLISKFGDDELCKELGIKKKNKNWDFKELNDYGEQFEVFDIQPNNKISSINGKVKIDYGVACKCGSMMIRTGVCYSCPGCGVTTGCM